MKAPDDAYGKKTLLVGEAEVLAALLLLEGLDAPYLNKQKFVVPHSLKAGQ